GSPRYSQVERCAQPADALPGVRARQAHPLPRAVAASGPMPAGTLAVETAVVQRPAQRVGRRGVSSLNAPGDGWGRGLTGERYGGEPARRLVRVVGAAVLAVRHRPHEHREHMRTRTAERGGYGESRGSCPRALRILRFSRYRLSVRAERYAVEPGHQHALGA